MGQLGKKGFLIELIFPISFKSYFFVFFIYCIITTVKRINIYTSIVLSINISTSILRLMFTTVNGRRGLKYSIFLKFCTFALYLCLLTVLYYSSKKSDSDEIGKCKHISVSTSPTSLYLCYFSNAAKSKQKYPRNNF